MPGVGSAPDSYAIGNRVSQAKDSELLASFRRVAFPALKDHPFPILELHSAWKSNGLPILMDLGLPNVKVAAWVHQFLQGQRSHRSLLSMHRHLIRRCLHEVEPSAEGNEFRRRF